MPAMMTQADLDHYLGQSMCKALIMCFNWEYEAGEDAFMFNTVIAHCIPEYQLPSVVVTKGACQLHGKITGTLHTLQSSVIIIYIYISVGHGKG